MPSTKRNADSFGRRKAHHTKGREDLNELTVNHGPDYARKKATMPQGEGGITESANANVKCIIRKKRSPTFRKKRTPPPNHHTRCAQGQDCNAAFGCITSKKDSPPGPDEREWPNGTGRPRWDNVSRYPYRASESL